MNTPASHPATDPSWFGDARAISTEQIRQLATRGWVALGDWEALLDPNAFHVLGPVAGLPASHSTGAIVVAVGRFRVIATQDPLIHPILMPADAWGRLPGVEVFVDAVGAAAAHLIGEIDHALNTGVGG